MCKEQLYISVALLAGSKKYNLRNVPDIFASSPRFELAFAMNINLSTLSVIISGSSQLQPQLNHLGAQKQRYC
ncbi:MAG: hypothetical protein V7K90_17040 [Nostoc sp.]